MSEHIATVYSAPIEEDEVQVVQVLRAQQPRRSKIIPWIRNHILYLFSLDDLHEHTLPACGENCVGFTQNGIIDISHHIPATCSTSGNVELTSVELSHDYKYLCCADNQKNIYVFSAPCNDNNLRSWKLFGYHSVSKKNLVKIQFDKQVKNLLMRDKGGDVYAATIEFGATNCITSLRKVLPYSWPAVDTILSEDSKLLFSSHSDKSIRISSFKEGRVKKILQGHCNPVKYIGLLFHDAILVSVCEQANIIIWVNDPIGSNNWMQYGGVTHILPLNGLSNPVLRARTAIKCLNEKILIRICLQHTRGDYGPLFLISLGEDTSNRTPQSEQIFYKWVLDHKAQVFDETFYDFDKRNDEIICKLPRYADPLILNLFPL